MCKKSTKNITNEFGFEFKESSTLMKNMLKININVK
jgi:hypothetical protein